MTHVACPLLQGVNAQYGGVKEDAVAYVQWLESQPVFKVGESVGRRCRWCRVTTLPVCRSTCRACLPARPPCPYLAALPHARRLPAAGPPLHCVAAPSWARAPTRTRPSPSLPHSLPPLNLLFQGLFYTVWPAEEHMYPKLRLKYRPNLISLAGGMQGLPITDPEARAIKTPVRHRCVCSVLLRVCACDCQAEATQRAKSPHPGPGCPPCPATRWLLFGDAEQDSEAPPHPNATHPHPTHQHHLTHPPSPFAACRVEAHADRGAAERQDAAGAGCAQQLRVGRRPLCGR